MPVFPHTQTLFVWVTVLQLSEATEFTTVDLELLLCDTELT